PAQQSHIRLRLGEVVQSDRTLNADDESSSGDLVEEKGEGINTRGVRTSDWRHLDNFSFDEFKAVIRVEDARLAHALEFVNRERVSGDFDRHRFLLLFLLGPDSAFDPRLLEQ